MRENGLFFWYVEVEREAVCASRRGVSHMRRLVSAARMQNVLTQSSMELTDMVETSTANPTKVRVATQTKNEMEVTPVSPCYMGNRGLRAFYCC